VTTADARSPGEAFQRPSRGSCFRCAFQVATGALRREGAPSAPTTAGESNRAGAKSAQPNPADEGKRHGEPVKVEGHTARPTLRARERDGLARNGFCAPWHRSRLRREGTSGARHPVTRCGRCSLPCVQSWTPRPTGASNARPPRADPLPSTAAPACAPMRRGPAPGSPHAKRCHHASQVEQNSGTRHPNVRARASAASVAAGSWQRSQASRRGESGRASRASSWQTSSAVSVPLSLAGSFLGIDRTPFRGSGTRHLGRFRLRQNRR
jgi:hypothetical protein